MHQSVPSTSIWVILAVICWGLSAFTYSFYYYQPTNTPNRWGFGLGVFPLGFFFYGLYLIFH
jgi:hypothetical protein